MIVERALFFANSCGNATARETITRADWLETFKQQHNFIDGPNVSDTKKSGSTVQAPFSTELMLGSMVSVPTVLPSILCPSPEVPSHKFCLPLTPTRTQGFTEQVVHDRLPQAQRSLASLLA